MNSASKKLILLKNSSSIKKFVLKNSSGVPLSAEETLYLNINARLFSRGKRTGDNKKIHSGVRVNEEIKSTWGHRVAHEPLDAILDATMEVTLVEFQS